MDGRERERFLGLLRRHGWNATSFQVLEPGFHYWFEDEDAGVAYVDTGAAWVAAGAPVAPEARLAQVAERFVAAARTAGRRASFFATEPRFVEALALDSLVIGEQPVWEPARWEASIRASKSSREQLRRARAKGVTVRRAAPEELERPDAPLRRDLERIATRWLHSRPLAPMGFLVQLELFSFPTERRLFVAERAGELVGVLNAVPVYARDGWLLEDVLRDPSAPNGTAELLVDAAMRLAAEEGATFATLGLVPLAGPVEGWLGLARKAGGALYDSEGLRAFKAKLRPHAWTPVSLSFPHGTFRLVAVLDALRAFARGDFVRFGIDTLLRGPTALLQLMAALLVPWTALLASAPAERWFPSAAVKWSWVAFDVLVTAGLFALTRRWRPWLSTLLASAVTLDAVLTLAQVLTFNAPRMHGPLDVAIAGLATCAPAFAAFLLWRARLHRAPDTARR